MKIKFGDNSLNLKVDGSLANIDRGPRGYSAYEIAVQEGFVGTEEEWLASLVGPEGKQGKDGERGIQGPRGQQGDKGDKGDKGDTGNDGHTPVKGVDYFTSEDIASLNIPYSLSDLSDDSTHRTVTDAEKSAWNNKYDKPSSGIPATDLSSGVQASLSKADTALQEHQDLTDYVKNTDYATSSKGGVVKSGSYAMGISATGNLRAITRTYSEYENDSANTFIGKGTLENVITGKDLVNQDALVQSQEVQDTNIEENASNIDWLQTLVNQMPTVSDQGTDLSLQDVLNYRLMKFLPQGVSSQDGEPAPTTPVPVKSVTGDNSLVLQNENLFDGVYYNTYTGGTSPYPYASANNTRSGIIKVQPNTTYTILKGTSNRFRMSEYEEYPVVGSSYAVKYIFPSGADTFTNYTLTTGNTTKYLVIQVTNESQENVPMTVVKGATVPTEQIPHEEQNYPIYLGGNVFELSKVTENVYINADGTTGTSSASNLSGYTPVIGGLTYNLTYDYETLLSQGRRGYCFYDSNQNYLSGTLYSSTDKTRQITIPTNARYFRFAYDKNCTNISLATDMTPIELNSSPDGTVRDGIYGSPEVSYNLWDEQWESGAFNNSTGAKINNTVKIRSKNYIPVIPNESYYWLKTVTSGTLYFYKKNYEFISYKDMASGTFTTPNDAYYLMFSVGSNSAPITTYSNDIMITEGTEAKPYFPYGQVGMWYKREYIYKFIITGNEDWQKYSTNRYYLVNSLIPVPIKYRGGTYCTHFKWNINQQSSILNNCIYSAGSTANLEIYPSQEFLSEYDNNQKFKTWLQSEYSNNNPVIAYYQRAESVDIPITDTTLILQLNDIYNNAHSYNGVTNITTTYEDGNEQMYLDIEALAKGGSITTETDPIFSASASSGITSSDISNWNNKADVEDIPDLTGYVKNTDYANSSVGGVITLYGNYATDIASNGRLRAGVKTYQQYVSGSEYMFIGKGTLENVITGKNFADKNYVDTAIATAITNTLGGSF